MFSDEPVFRVLSRGHFCSASDSVQHDPLPRSATQLTAMSDLHLPAVGWREWLSLPEIGVPRIKAKIDTGARTSALHIHDFEVFRQDDRDHVRFHLHPLTREPNLEHTCQAPVLDYREVKDSGGHAENRPFIRTRAKLGPVEWDIDLSLTNREGMKFRMLLGREALAGRFLVDPQAGYLHSPKVTSPIE